MSYSDVELLAPAGNFESLRQAISGGANAVYLGLKEFSARAKAANFSLEELDSAIKYAHLFDVSVYVAVNTLIKDSEMNAAAELIAEAEKLGADAFILQDLGLLFKIRDITNVPLHASTQMGIHNVYGAVAAKKLGFDRIILSREATLQDIREIKDKVDIEIEAFIQGALCVAFSGNCLFSSAVSGYSGNRGKCMQLCRKKYDIEINGLHDSGYYLSAKDLCRLANLNELIDCGVSSLKIEGRMRRPEYVGESASVYREALNALSEKKPYDLDSAMRRLKLAFNRGDYCDGYLKDGTENVIYPRVQGHKGLKVGTVDKVYGKKAIIDGASNLHIGDGLKFVGKRGETGGCEVRNKDCITFEGNVRAGDEVFLTSDSEQLKAISRRNKKLNLSYAVTLKKGAFATVKAASGKETVTYTSSIIPEQARTAPIAESQIKAIFSKSQCEFLSIESVRVDSDSDIFLSVGQLKELRRSAEKYAIEYLSKQFHIVKKRKNRENMSIMSDIILQNPSVFGNILAECDSLETLKMLSGSELCDGIIYSPRNYSDLEELRKAFSASGKPIFLDTPIMARGKDLDILKRIAESGFAENIVANNLYALELFAEKNILLGPGMNLLNHGVNLQKISPLESDRPSKDDYVVAFSRLPLMTFAHCPYKNLRKRCSSDCNGFRGTLKDERGNTFELTHYKVGYCYSKLLNAYPLDIRNELKTNGYKRIVYDFRDCSAKLADNVLNNLLVTADHTHFNFNKKLQ